MKSSYTVTVHSDGKSLVKIDAYPCGDPDKIGMETSRGKMTRVEVCEHIGKCARQVLFAHASGAVVPIFGGGKLYLPGDVTVENPGPGLR